MIWLILNMVLVQNTVPSIIPNVVHTLMVNIILNMAPDNMKYGVISGMWYRIYGTQTMPPYLVTYSLQHSLQHMVLSMGPQIWYDILGIRSGAKYGPNMISYRVTFDVICGPYLVSHLVPYFRSILWHLLWNMFILLEH